MIKELYICLALLNMNGVVNQNNICNNIQTINNVSIEYNVDSTLLVSLLWIESGFNSNIVGYTGRACGISQIIPRWSSDYNKYKSIKKKKAERERVCNKLNSNTPFAIKESARILSAYRTFYKNKRYYLCGYNKGYRCNKENPKLLKSGLKYADEILKFQKRLKRQIRKERRGYKEISKIFVSVIKNLIIL